MKKVLTGILFCLIPLLGISQTFNYGKSFGQGNFALGVAPAVHKGGPSNGLNLFLHAGYGLKQGVDLALKFGLGREYYFGAELEWGLLRFLALTTGLHSFGHFGLDAGLNLSFPIRSDTRFYTGIDMDLIFADQLQAPFWLPVGIELGLRRDLYFILEGGIGLNPEAWHIIDLGINIYF